MATKGIDMQIAKQLVSKEFAGHAGSLELILDFLETNPEFVSKGRASKKAPFNSEEWWRKWALKYVNGRELRPPSFPKTKSDPVVTHILKNFFDIPDDQLETAIWNHASAMAAENIIGSLLEAYLASHLEPNGWIWCSGETVKSIDFILVDDVGDFHPLQVKNRSNSENSSSAAIRDGTSIQKWHRIDATSGKTQWGKFPEEALKGVMTEEGFVKFISDYIQGLKSPSD